MDRSVTFEQAQQAVVDFVAARGWNHDATSRGLAISLSLEANELLEHFQWQEEPLGTPAELASELADVVIYAIQFAHRYEIDLPTAIIDKLAQQNLKYPEQAFQTGDEAHRHQAWVEAKRTYRQKTTL